MLGARADAVSELLTTLPKPSEGWDCPVCKQEMRPGEAEGLVQGHTVRGGVRIGTYASVSYLYSAKGFL